jgi:hypothetical protein
VFVPCVERLGESWYVHLSVGIYANLVEFMTGILPRDGKNISFPEMTNTVRATYNFSPTFSFFVPNYAARTLNKSYGKDRFDLADLDFHNGIEHDASLLREFSFFSMS